MSARERKTHVLQFGRVAVRAGELLDVTQGVQVRRRDGGWFTHLEYTGIIFEVTCVILNVKYMQIDSSKIVLI